MDIRPRDGAREWKTRERLVVGRREDRRRMQGHVRRLPILLIGVLLCAGCGTGYYSHEIDLVVEPETTGAAIAGLKAGVISSYPDREEAGRVKVVSVDNSGVIHLVHNATSSSWVWQQRPSLLMFDLFVPSVSTNGYFNFCIREASKLPWRGLRRGLVSVQGTYYEFDTRIRGNRPLQPLRAEIMASSSGGYHVKMNLSSGVLRAALNAGLVPYRSNAGEN